jgi:hypothetical protein
MQKEFILEELRADLPKLKKDFGVKSIGLFGSYANNTENQESDLDFFVDLNPPYANNYFGLLFFLEQKFGTKVDLVKRGKHLRDKFLKQVESEIVYV